MKPTYIFRILTTFSECSFTKCVYENRKLTNNFPRITFKSLSIMAIISQSAFLRCSCVFSQKEKKIPAALMQHTHGLRELLRLTSSVKNVIYCFPLCICKYCCSVCMSISVRRLSTSVRRLYTININNLNFLVSAATAATAATTVAIAILVWLRIL